MRNFDLIRKEFNGLEVDFIEKDNDLWLTGEQIGSALEYEFPKEAIRKIYERNEEELDEYSCFVKLASCEVTLGGVNLTPPGGKQQTRVFNEQGVMIITMLSRQPKAREFRKWAVQVLKAYRHGDLLAMTPKARQLSLIDKTFRSATRIAKSAGLSKNQAILKASEITKSSIGIDVFEYLGTEKPRDDTKSASEFFTILDDLLEKGLITNYCLDESEIYIRMNEVFEAAKQHLGANLSKRDYPSVKRNSRFISSAKKVHNRLSDYRTASTWAFQNK